MSSIFSQASIGSRFYAITDRQLSGLSHTEQVQILVQNGACTIQLREKLAPPSEFFEDARAAIAIAHRHGAKIIINDRVDLALALRADGVHVGHDDLPADAARRLLAAGTILGLSTHNADQARRASALPIDYVAIGPIFSTNTKASNNPAVGVDGVTHVREILGKLPLVAIGGITADNAAAVIAAGADAVAVIGDIWAAQSPPADQIREFLKLSAAPRR